MPAFVIINGCLILSKPFSTSIEIIWFLFFNFLYPGLHFHPALPYLRLLLRRLRIWFDWRPTQGFVIRLYVSLNETCTSCIPCIRVALILQVELVLQPDNICTFCFTRKLHLCIWPVVSISTLTQSRS